ncbi:MAG: sulfatase-like hydrolase/transferase [Pseudomonadota bacterium]
MGRPSFVLYITDQHRADFLGCAGHPVLRTPNIDSLAARGARYDNFFVASPVCMPNRASLMTARMPACHGVRMNGVPLSRRNVTFVELLRDAGYKTALIGKSHLQPFSGKPPGGLPGSPRPGFHQATGSLKEAVRHDLAGPNYGYEDAAFWADPDARLPTPYYGFDHVELVTGHGDRLGGDYRRWLLDRAPEADTLIGAQNQLPHDYICPQAVRTAVPEALYSTTYIAERAQAWIAEQAGGDEPFFLMVSFPDPHHPFNPPGRYWDMYDPDDMPVPASFTAADWAPPPHVAGVIAARAAGQANLNGMPAIGCSAREAQEAQALTCGMISMIDDAIGQVEAALDQAALAPVRLFTSDHGDHLGDHGLLFKGAEQYDQITRVPFIWCDPDGEPDGAPRGVQHQIGQTIDIGPTILNRARIEPAWGMQGLPLTQSTTRDAALVQYAHQKPMDGVGVAPHVHSLVSARYRLSVFEGLEWGELYDLHADPGELHNLWDAPEAQPARAEMTEALLRAELAHIDRAPYPVARA